MIGQYDPKRRVVTVKRLIGSSHRLYGHSDKNGTHFELYEALYLMEIVSKSMSNWGTKNISLNFVF